MRILEICPYSAGICGVWTRVREEALRLQARGHEVRVFSSYFVKGTNESAACEDEVEGLQIRRFPALKPGSPPLHFLPGGESYMFWRFTKEALAYEPEVIIAHNYRHFHNDLALRVANVLKKKGKRCKVFLVTHAPFPEGDITRSFWGHAASWFYDFFVGRFSINKFDKVFPISLWEIPILQKLGLKKNKIAYIPNGIPEEFFTQKKSKEQHKILFLGRIAPKKKIETLIAAIPLLRDKKIPIEIVGPREKEYSDYLMKCVQEHKVSNRIVFAEPVYSLKKKIEKIDSGKLFVLPSRVEGMPQALIEAMARGKTVIGSDSLAIRDLIKEGSNGYLFEFDNPSDLARTIDKALSQKKLNEKKVQNSVKEFAWNKVISKIESEISR